MKTYDCQKNSNSNAILLTPNMLQKVLRTCKREKRSKDIEGREEKGRGEKAQ